MHPTVASKNQQPSTVPRAVTGTSPKPQGGLWLDVSPLLGSHQGGAGQGPQAGQGLWLVPGQTQTLQAQASRRYQLGLRAKPAPTEAPAEALIPPEQPVLVLRHGADLWLTNAQGAGLVLNGFFDSSDNILDIELGDQAWRVDGLATGQPIAGSQAHLLYWHGQAAQWPDAFNVSTADGGFELHKTQWQSVPLSTPAGEGAASSAATHAANVTSSEAARAIVLPTNSAATLTAAEAAASSAAALAPAEAASAASAATAGTASGAAAQTAAGSAAAGAAGTSTVAAAATAAVGVGGAAVGSVAMGVVAIAVGTSGAKTDAVASTSSTNNNTNTVTNQAPTGVALTTALTGNAILETASTATRTKVADIAVTDDALGTNSITLSGADAASFEVVGNALYLKANVALRYSTQSQYNVTVNVADSTASSTAAVTSAYQLNITGVPTNLGGSFTAGPAISGNGLEVQVYRADTGALLTTTKVGNDGTYSFNVTYVGAVIVVIRDVDADPNNPGADYLDEANGAVDLATDLRSITYVGTPGVAVTANVTPLTEIAATLATGKTAAEAAAAAANGAGYAAPTLTATSVANTNKALAQMLGLGDVDVTTAVANAITDASGNTNANVNDYGRVLAAISHAGDLKSVIATMASGINIDASAGTASFKTNATGGSSTSTGSMTQALLAQGMAGAEIAHSISFTSIAVLQEVKTKGEQAAGQSLLQNWVSFEEQREAASGTWAKQSAYTPLKTWAVQDKATAAQQKAALLNAASVKQSTQDQLAQALTKAQAFKAQAQADLAQSPDNPAARKALGVADANLGLLNSLNAQQGSVDTTAGVGFNRQSNYVRAAVKILDNSTATSASKDNALVFLNTSLKAVRLQEDTQINKAASLTITLSPIADKIDALAQAQAKLKTATDKTAAQAAVDLALNNYSQAVKVSADLIAADKSAADAWSQALVQASKAQKTLDSAPAGSAEAKAAQAALTKANNAIALSEKTAAEKAAAEKVFTQNLDTAQKAQASAQAAFDKISISPAASAADKATALAALSLAQAAAQTSFGTLANKTAAEKVAADNLAQSIAKVQAAEQALSSASTPAQKAAAEATLKAAQTSADGHLSTAANKASAENGVAQAQALQAGLVDSAQAALSRAQEVLAGLPSTASAQTRAQAQAAVAQAQKDLSASQNDLAQAQALAADKAAADKAGADAWAQAQAQAAQAQAVLATAPAGSAQAVAAQAALTQANKAAAQAQATAAQKAAADKVYAQAMAEGVQAQASAQAALDAISANPSASVADKAAALAALSVAQAAADKSVATLADKAAAEKVAADNLAQGLAQVQAAEQALSSASTPAQKAAAEASLKAAQTGVDKIQLTAANKASAEQVLAQSWAQAQAQAEAAQAAIDQAQQTLTSLANDNSTQALATKAAAQAALSAATTQLSSAQANSAALADNAAAKASAEGAVAQAQALQAGLVDNAQAALSRAQEVLAGLPSTASATERQAASLALNQAEQALGTAQVDLARQQALAADKAAADKVAADALAAEQARTLAAEKTILAAQKTLDSLVGDTSAEALATKAAAQAAIDSATEAQQAAAKAVAQQQQTMLQKALDQEVQAQALSDNLQRISQAQALLDAATTTPSELDAAKEVIERSQNANQAQLQALADKFAQEKLYQVQSAMAQQVSLVENSTAALDLSVAGVADLSWRLLSNSDASAFTLSSDGRLRFTSAKNFEADTRSFSLQVELSDGAGHSVTQALSVRLANVNEAPQLTTPLPASAKVLLNQLFVLNAASAFIDVDANDSLRFTATGLPPGLSIDANGLITGVATRLSASGTVRITATDLAGLSAETTIVLSVVDVPGIIGAAAAPQADRLVHSGDSTAVAVNFTEAVNVQGSPLLNLLVNDQAVQATYTSGSGSNQLVFTFTTPSLGNGTDVQVLGLDLANASVVGKATGLDALTQASAVRTRDITVDNTAPAAPTLALADDTGWDASDGVAKPGDIVVGGLETGAQWAYRTSVDGEWVAGSGNRFALAQGHYSAGQVQVRQTDAAGNLGHVGSNPIYLRIDSTAPTATVALELPGGASVLKANTTATVRLTLSEPLADLPLITSGAGALSPWQKISDTEYTATFNPVSDTQGEFDLNLGAFQDRAGNAGDYASASAKKITIDTRPPEAPRWVLSDSGRSDSDGVTQTTVLGVQGLEAGGSWSYSVDSGVTWLAGGAVSNGQSSVTLSSGTYAVGQLLVRQTDSAGNLSAVAGNPAQWGIDTSAPTLSVGNVAGDNVVNQAERGNGVLIAGGSTGAIAGDVVNVTWGTTTLSTVVGSDGTWRVGFASGQIPSGEASASVKVRITDLAGNSTEATQSVRIDTLAPTLALPTNLMPSVATGLGVGVQGVLVDNILNSAERAAIVGGPDGTWTLQGATNAEAAQAVTVYLNGKPYSGTVGSITTDNARVWSAPITSADVALLVHGNRYPITVDTLDSAGNPAQRASQILDVSLYPADIPTVFVSQNNSYTPTLGGLAQKLASANSAEGVALASEDVLTVAIRAGTTEVVSYTLVMGAGTTHSAGPLSYDTLTKQWKLDLSQAASTDARVSSDGVYDVAVSVLPKGFNPLTDTKTDQSSGEWVVKTAAPVLTWATTQAGDNRINAIEVQSGVTLSGTVVDAMPGNNINAAAGRSVTLGLTGLAADHPLYGKTWAATVQANGNWSAAIAPADLLQLGTGEVSWKARFESLFGTSQQASTSLTLDTQGPVINLTTPADVAISDSEAQVWFTSLAISDALSGVDTATQTVRLYRGTDWVANPDLALQTNSDGLAARLTADLSRLSDGNYTIEVQAKDRAGNLSSQSLALRLDQTAPTLTLSTDAAGLRVQKGEQATIRLSLSEAASALPGITPSAGSLSAWQPVANSAHVYEAQWTPPTDGNGILSWTVGPWRDTAGNTGYTLGQAPAIQFDTLTPEVKSLQVLGDSSDQRFKAGETLEAHVVFSEDMLVNGQPTLALQVGDQTRSARYIGRLVGSDATLVFRYVVQPGDTDTDGVSINADALRLGTSGASITDLFGNPAELGHASVAAATLAKVDTTAPTVSVSLTGGTDTALAQGETATLKLLFSEQPQALPLVATTQGSLSQWTRVSDIEYTATFRPAANTSAGAVVWGMDTWKDLAGNLGTMLGNWPGLTVDTIAPVVTAVSDTTVASITKDNVRFVVTLSEVLDTPLTTTHFSASNGTISSVQASANGLQYTVDVTPNANTQQLPLALSLVANGVKDLSGNALANQDLSSLNTQVVDTQAPNLNSVTVPGNPAKPVYKAGEEVLVNLAFSEVVQVNGAPSMGLNVGGQIRTASYKSGSGTSTLVFGYTVQAGDTDTDGVSIAGNAVQLQSGESGQTGSSIVDVAGNNAVVVHSAVGASANAQVDTQAPKVALSSADYRLQASDSATVTISFSEDPGNTFGIADLSLSGGSISAITGTGKTREVTFVPNADLQGAASISVASNTFTDAAGNANADGGEIDNRVDFSVDTLAPLVQSVAVFAADNITASGWLNAGDRVRAKVVFTEAVTFAGSDQPSLALSAGGQDLIATYLSGSGTSEWVFQATIAQGLNDSAGVAVKLNGLSLPSGGTLRDDAGNHARLAHASVAANSGYKVDTQSPSLGVDAVTGDDAVNLSDKTAGVSLSGTSDELGATVAVQWGDQSLSATVGADGRWRITPSTLPADGAATLSVSVSDAAGNTSSVQRSTRLDTAAPTLSLSTPLTNGAGQTGDADNILNRAEYDAAITAGALNLRGASDAETNSPVALLFNGKSYATTVQNGQWSLALPSADLALLVNGNDYALAVGVRDSAGNPTSLSNTSLQVRLTTADVPTVQSLTTNTLTPTLEGTAQKVSGSTFVALGSNDLLAVSVNGRTFTWVNGVTQQVNGTSSLADLVAGYAQSTTFSPSTSATTAVLSYNSTNARWSLTVPAGVIAQSGVYDVQVGVKAEGNPFKVDPGQNELAIQSAPATVTVGTLAGDGFLNASESANNLALSGSVSDPAAGDSTRNTAVGRSLSVALVGANNSELHTLSATVGEDGTWSASVPSRWAQGVADASITVRASYTSLYGGSVSASRLLVLDTTAPSLSVTTPSDTVLTAAQASAFGLDYATSDSVTNAPTRQLQVLNAAQQVQAGIVFTDSNARLSADLSALAEGSYDIKVTSTDQAGNTASQTVAVVIDKTAPTISAIERGTNTGVGSGGETNLDSVDFIVTFSETPLNLLASDFKALLGGVAIASNITLGEPVALGGNRYRISLSGTAISGGNGVLSLGLAAGQVVTDSAGNALSTSLPSSATYTLDHLPPTAVLSSITDDVGPNVGALSAGARTNDTQVEIAGTNLSGSTVKVYNGNTLLGAATVVGTQWTYTATITNGSSYDFKATETDKAGNTSAATAGFALISDTTAPSAPDSVFEQGSTRLGNGSLSASEAAQALVVRVALPTSGVVAIDGDTVALQLNGADLATPAAVVITAAHRSNGYVEFSLTQAILGSDGSKALSARLFDAAGNTSGPSTALSFTLDASAPTAPGLVEQGSTKLADGFINITEVASSTIVRLTLPTTGSTKAQVGDSLVLTLGGAALSTTVLTNAHITAGSVDVTIASAAWGNDGSKTLSASLTDAAGNPSSGNVGLSLTVDKTAPTQTIQSTAFTPDSGSSGGDFITQTAALTISGGLSAALGSGETVKVSLDGGNSWANANWNAASGVWSLASQTLSGSGSLQVKVVDAAGNSGSLLTQAYVLDTTPTAAPTVVESAGLTADGYLNAAEASTGLTVRVNLPNAGVLAQVGDKVELLIGGFSLLTPKTLTDADMGGGFVSFAVSQANLGADGPTKTLSARITDVAGNVSAASAAIGFALDTVAPTNTVSTITIDQDSGSLGDFITNTQAQTIGGNLTNPLSSGDTVWVSLNSGQSWRQASTTANSPAWSLANASLSGGNGISVQVRDTAGNVGDTKTQAYTLDITAPGVDLNTAILPNASSIYVRSSERGSVYLVRNSVSVTNLASITSAADNLVNSASVTSANTDTLLALSGLSDGTYVLYASDVAGNLSLVSSNSMEVDNTAPSAIAQVSLSADTGTSNSDFITKTAAQTITGSLSQAAGAGQKVRISLNNGSAWTDVALATGATNFSLSGQTLLGNNTLKAKVVAANGLESLAWTQDYVLDTSAPSAPTLALGVGVATGATSAEATAAGGVLTLTADADTSVAVTFTGQGGSVTKTLTGNGAAVVAVVLSDANLATLGEGLVSVSAVATDAAGNPSAASSASFTLDTAVPPAPTLTLGVGVTGGATSAEGTAAGGVVTVAAEAASSVMVTFTGTSGSVSKTVTGNGAAAVAVVLSSANLATLGEGLVSVSAVATDVAGNPGDAGSTSFTLDTLAPTTLSGITLSPTGGYVVANALNSSNTAMAFTATIGAGEATGGKAEFYVNGALVGTDSSIASGDTSVAYTTSDGTPISAELQAAITAGGTVSVTLYDQAGNTFSASGPTLLRDLVAPTNTVTAVSFSADMGSSNTDFVTNTAAQTISGSLNTNLATGDSVWLSIDNGSTWAQAMANVGTSTWSLARNLVGSNTLKVKVQDAAGNDGTIYSQAYVLDTAAPTVTGVAISSASSIQNNRLNAGDTVTLEAVFSEAITVNTSGGSPILELNIGGTLVNASYVDGSGTNRLTFNYTILAGQNDADGISVNGSRLLLNGSTMQDVSGDDALLSYNAVQNNASYMVDTAAPALLSSTPRDGGTISATATSMTLTFGEAVQRGTGNLVVYDTANNTAVKSYAIATSTDIGFSANNTVLTLSGLSLTAATNYHIKVDSGAITDLATNSYAGFNDTTTLNFATPGVPVIDLGGVFGKLIAPVQVEDKWYYYWDLSGDGTNGGIDAQTMDWLERTFYNGVSTGAVITENNRTFSINGVNVKLPTYGGATNNGVATPTDGINAFQKGTAVANTSTINTTYDDLLAIWDALNGNVTTTNNGSNSTATLPTHWKSGRYWSATQTANNPHAIVNLASGFVNNQLPDGSADTYFALQVL